MNSGLEPLLPPRERDGCVFSIARNLSDRPGSVELDLFVDAGGAIPLVLMLHAMLIASRYP